MNNPLLKKIIIIGSVVLAVVIGAVVLAVTVGNTQIPSIENPDEVFYERLDSEGNVIYTITNAEIYEQIKSNNGIQQLLMMVDTALLTEYLDEVTETEIADKLKQLTYGTKDDDEILEIDPEDKLSMEEDFARSMVLAGYEGKEDAYASLLIAREKYAYEAYLNELTETEVATAFISSYFDDMKAINIRFTSREDALAVLRMFHLAEIDSKLAIYKGFTYNDESLKDLNGDIVDVYTTIDTYYFDENDNLNDVKEETVYTLGTNGFYTDEDDASYSLDSEGNLVDDELNIVVSKDNIFETLEEAETHKENNTTYYYMSKTDPYDLSEDILIKNDLGEVVYTRTSNSNIYDSEMNDVTSTHDLIFNKVYKKQENVTTFTSNNTSALTEQEVLNYYILMYNYVYGEFRNLLPEGSSKQSLVLLDNDYLSFNFEDTKDKSAALATYIFKTISQLNDKVYSSRPQSVSQSSATFYYMTFKLQEPTKLNLGKTILDLIESSIVLPETVVDDFVLPSNNQYGATISWVSADKTVISNTGEVTTPDVPTIVDMSYTIKVLGETRTGKISVNVLPTGETSEVTEPTISYPSLKTLINNDAIYNEISQMLVDEKVYGSSGATNISKKLVTMRNEVEFEIFDYYMAQDYRETDPSFEQTNSGDKTVLARTSKTLTSEEAIEFTADDLFIYALEKNPAIYTVYASQFKELLYSEYYVEAFGEERNINKNDTARMDEMHSVVANSKQYYIYMKSLYEQYGMSYPHRSFLDYAYSQYGTKTETELLQYFINSELRPYLINSIIEEYDIVENLYDIVEENYDNYFSLDVVQLLIFFDFNEDGNPDDYNEYVDSLNATQKDELIALTAAFENAIREYDSNFTDLVNEYLKATRDDETWGEFKQAGFLLLTEDLNIQDSEDQEVTHSLNYSGEYGVKDRFVPEFTEALIDLYQEYRLPQNADLEELVSSLVVTEFGLHLLLVEQGDDFEQFSAAYSSDAEDADKYSEAVFNDSDKPTLAQLELYAQYKFYAMVYDLSDTEIEQKFNITVPKIPNSVSEALEFYFDEVISEFYVLGTVNIRMAQLLQDGNFLGNDALNMTNAELIANLVEIEEAYYGAILSKYLD